jgi:hypothetical protein
MLPRMICLCLMLIAALDFGRMNADQIDLARLCSAVPFQSESGLIADRERPMRCGGGFTDDDRARAIYRGLEFIYSTARSPRNFAQHGHDYLWCFDTTARAMKDPVARRMAWSMGGRLARRWLRGHRSLPPRADADAVFVFASAADSARELGVTDDTIKEKIKRAATRLSPQEFLDFDPAIEPPPSDVPDDCPRCGRHNQRGSRVCLVCKARLKMRSRYDIWCDALIVTWSGDRYGVMLGGRYADVIKWLPQMRPYRGREGGANAEFFDTVYAVTHLVYTLNDYSLYNLSPGWLPQEFEFLKASLKESIAMNDPDMLGEFMDSLKSFGLTNDDPLIRVGAQYLMSHQNRDGSWGHMRLRYHPTWTAIDGLSDYAWHGERLSFPELRPLLEQWAASSSHR